MQIQLPAFSAHVPGFLRVVPQEADSLGQALAFAVAHPKPRAGLNIPDDVALVHNGKQGDALHHVAVGLAGNAKPRGALFQRNQRAVAYRQRVLKILTVKEAENPDIFNALAGNDLPQLLGFGECSLAAPTTAPPPGLPGGTHTC